MVSSSRIHSFLDSDGARKLLRIPIASPAFIRGLNLKSQILNRLTLTLTNLNSDR
ncbi:MAG: hypothetical protein U7126_01180 [Microcoleus sp.]